MDHEDDEEMNPSSGLGEIPIEDYLRITGYKPKMSKAKKALLALGLMVSAGAGYATPFWTGAYMWDGNLHDANILLQDMSVVEHRRGNAGAHVTWFIIDELDILLESAALDTEPSGRSNIAGIAQIASRAIDHLHSLSQSSPHPGFAQEQREILRGKFSPR